MNFCFTHIAVYVYTLTTAIFKLPIIKKLITIIPFDKKTLTLYRSKNIFKEHCCQLDFLDLTYLG